MLVGSQQGGVDIEQVAKDSPEAIVKMGVDIINGLLNSWLKHANNLSWLCILSRNYSADLELS